MKERKAFLSITRYALLPRFGDTDFDIYLEYEIDRFNVFKTYKYPDTSMSSAIRIACHEAHVNHTNALHAIKMYTRRNRMMHCSISNYIKESQYEKLAIQLDRDIKDVPYVFGEKERDQMLAVLEYIRDLYFDDLEDPESPILSEKAIRRLEERRKRRLRALQCSGKPVVNS